MNRDRFRQLKGLLKEFFYPQDFTNPFSPGPLPPMTLARPPISSSDLVAEVSVGLIEPFSVCVAHSPRNIRETARHSVIKSYLKRLPNLTLLLEWRNASTSSPSDRLFGGIYICR